MKALFDSNVYIRSWHDTAFYEAIERVWIQLRSRTFVSAVVIGECWAGAKDNASKKLVSGVFNPYERAKRIIAPSYADWKEAGRLLRRMIVDRPNLRQRLPWLWNDLLIALLGLRIGAIVYTANRDDFELIQNYGHFELVVL